MLSKQKIQKISPNRSDTTGSGLSFGFPIELEE